MLVSSFLVYVRRALSCGSHCPPLAAHLTGWMIRKRASCPRCRDLRLAAEEGFSDFHLHPGTVRTLLHAICRVLGVREQRWL
jgi:hypothetical protein